MNAAPTRPVHLWPRMWARRPEPAPPRHRDVTQDWDADTFAQLYDDTAARVYGIVLCVVGDPTCAAEITEQVYLELWRGRMTRTWTPTSTVAVLLAQAHWLAVDRVRSSGTRDDLDRVYSAGTVVSQLPATQRRAIELTYFCGQLLPDAAHTMHISPEAITGQITGGLVRLQRTRAAADPR